MKFVIDFDELEGIKDQLQIMTEEIDEFVEAMKALKEEVVDKSELDAITKILETQKEAIDQMKEIKTAFETAYDDLDQYMNGIDEINGYTVGEVYKHDTVEFTELLQRALRICMKEFNIDLIKELSYESYVEDYEKLMRDYNHAEAYIDLEKDYKDDTQTQEYIKKRRKEIEIDIQNFKFNSELIEEMSGNLTKFQKVLEGYEAEFVKLKGNNTELEEYEKGYNPGFSDKHGELIGIAHIFLSVAGATPGIGWVADMANAALYLAEGNVVAALGSALAVIPGLKAGRKLFKGSKSKKAALGNLEKHKQPIGIKPIQTKKPSRPGYKKKGNKSYIKKNEKYKKDQKIYNKNENDRDNYDKAKKENKKAKNEYDAAVKEYDEFKELAKQDMEKRGLITDITSGIDIVVDKDTSLKSEAPAIAVEKGIEKVTEKGRNKISSKFFEAIVK